MKNIVQILAKLELESVEVLSSQQKRDIRGGYGYSSCTSGGPVRLFINYNCSDGYPTCGCSDCANIVYKYPASSHAQCAVTPNYSSCTTLC